MSSPPEVHPGKETSRRDLPPGTWPQLVEAIVDDARRSQYPVQTE